MCRLTFSLFFLPFLLLLLPSGAFAQTPGCFKAYDLNGVELTEICAGVPIRFKDCSCPGTPPNPSQNPEYYDLDKSNQVTFDPIQDLNSPTKTFTFPNPGTYTVTQLHTLVCDQNRSQWEEIFVVKATTPPVFTAVACGSDSVRITNTDNIYDTYEVFINNTSFGNMSPGQIKAFAAGGTYTVKLTGRHTLARCENSATQTLTANAAPALATITKLDVLQTSAHGEIQLTISGLQSGYTYSLEQRNSSGFSQVQVLTFNNSVSETLILNSLNTAVANCFRVRVFDNCGNSQGLTSPEICSTVLEATAQNRKNVISWLPYTGDRPNGGTFVYLLSRQEGTNTPETLNLPNPVQTTFEDTTISCGVNYCYEVAVVEGSNAFSLSNTACAVAVSTDVPKPAFLLTSFGTDNVLNGTINLPGRTTLKGLQVFKNLNNGNFIRIQTTATTGFRDAAGDFKPGPVCYQVIYADNCNNTSDPSNVSCPVVLTAIHDRSNRTVALTWTPYNGFKGTSVTYTLEILDKDFQLSSSKPVTGILSLTETNLSNDDQILRFRIKAETELGEISYSNSETVVQDVKIFVPSAFSPNHDGLNDMFAVKGRFQNNFRLVILNRWGQIIFESNSPEKGWNGMVNGSEAPVGVYAYRLSTIDETGAHFDKSGTLTLVR
jgi:gliding motility-associated-like protein